MLYITFSVFSIIQSLTTLLFALCLLYRVFSVVEISHADITQYSVTHVKNGNTGSAILVNIVYLYTREMIVNEILLMK